MKSVIPSLFNFLDKKGKGFVTFEELTLRIYPTLTGHNIATINKWVKSYSKTLQRDQKTRILKDEKEEDNIVRKKILPHSTMKRFKELFELYDEEHQGCKNLFKKPFFIDFYRFLIDLLFPNIKNNFSNAFSQKELEDMFTEFADKEGKMNLDQFAKMLLPAEYIIDEKDEPLKL